MKACVTKSIRLAFDNDVKLSHEKELERRCGEIAMKASDMFPQDEDGELYAVEVIVRKI